jgi:ketosteroid isomerase-like protein
VNIAAPLPGRPQGKEAHVRRLSIGATIGILMIALAACTGSNVDAAAEQSLQQEADRYEIDQIEKNFHEATATKNIDQMVSLWAPNATLTLGPGETATGPDEIRRYFLEKSLAFNPKTHWLSDHPAYKIEITVNGDRGTLHFECHYIDYDTGEVVQTTSADMDVARIDGHWLITNMVGASAELAP